MKRNILVLSLLISAFLFVFSSNTFAAGQEEDKTSFIMHHVKDSHEWHIATLGDTHVTLALPVIVYSGDRGLEFFSSTDFQDHQTHAFGESHAHEGYFIDEHDHLGRVDQGSFIELSITKNVVMLFIVLFIVGWMGISAASYYKKNGPVAPKGIAAIVEPIVIFIRDDIAKESIGPQYRRFVPYLITLFMFILFGNLMGLLPGSANLTGNIAVTLVLAVITFIITNVNGNKAYWKHVFMTPGVPPLMLLIIVPVEIIGLFTKPFALTVRLFVAITAGHIVILGFVALAFIFESYTIGIASTLMVTFINIIEILVAAIQAYVFTLFSAMYIGGAVAEHAHADH
jgi:F-type H+-transporting ATPase subunit a